MRHMAGISYKFFYDPSLLDTLTGANLSQHGGIMSGHNQS